MRAVARYNDLPDHCGVTMRRVICAPMVTVDIPAYQSVVTGETIQGRAKHREHLKRHDLVEIGTEKIGQKPREYRADHNVKPEMMEAIKQHLGR